MTTEPRKIPAPAVGPETKAFWDAASEGRLLIKRCGSCEKPHYYPRGLCPHCMSQNTRWEETSGTGSIYSFAVLRRGPGAPYTVAYVSLPEGVTMLTNIVDCDFNKLEIGQAVELRFAETDGGPPVPVFTPSEH